MKLAVLSDNCAVSSEFESEHGLSWYIDTGTTRILFDTGQSDLFTRNAQRMGIDLAKTDFLIISHGHYDHTGGIKTFLDLNEKARIILHEDTIRPKFHGNRYIGIDSELTIPAERTLHLTRELHIVPGIIVVGSMDIPYPCKTHFQGFHTRNAEGITPDRFTDELILMLEEERGLSLFTGCSHSGIINIVETVKSRFDENIHAIFGGFHLSSSSRDDVLETGEYLARQQFGKVVTCHCTGFENYRLMKEKSIPDLEYGFAGKIFIE